MLLLKAETYGQFADNSARVAQEKVKQKTNKVKRRIGEATYYREGNTYTGTSNLNLQAMTTKLYTAEPCHNT